MDKGLKAVFQKTQAMMAHNGVPSTPQPPPQPPASTSALFPQSAPLRLRHNHCPCSTCFTPHTFAASTQKEAISSAGDIYPQRRRRSPLPLLRLHKQRHLVLRLRLLRHPSPPKGRPPEAKASSSPSQSLDESQQHRNANTCTHSWPATPTSSTHVDAKSQWEEGS